MMQAREGISGDDEKVRYNEEEESGRGKRGEMGIPKFLEVY